MNRLSSATLNYLARSQSIQARGDSYADDLPTGRSVPVMRRTETADEYHARCLAFGESYRNFIQESRKA